MSISLQPVVIRSRESGPHRFFRDAAFDCWPFDHNRGHDRREAEGKESAAPAMPGGGYGLLEAILISRMLILRDRQWRFVFRMRRFLLGGKAKGPSHRSETVRGARQNAAPILIKPANVFSGFFLVSQFGRRPRTLEPRRSPIALFSPPRERLTRRWGEAI